MKPFEVISFPNDQELADAAARDWLALCQSSPRPHRVALSGGRIAKTFFAATTILAQKSPGALKDVDFFWADERCVPPSDPESNFSLAEENLFQPLRISPEHIHRLKGELPPAQAVAEANADIRRAAPKKNGNDIPVLDLIILGLGEDGHTASLMPNAAPSVAQSRQPYVHVDNSPKPPPNRLTMTYPMLAAAKEVWMLAAGTGKEAALRNSLNGTGQTPFARVLDSRSWTRIFSSISI
jgi:6-phosphogluconolactonase